MDRGNDSPDLGRATSPWGAEGSAGDLDDSGTRAVVGPEVDGPGCREPTSEVSHEVGIRPVPAVDGLVGVTNEGEIGVVADDGEEEVALRRVQVLRFVEAQVLVAPPDGCGEASVVVEERGRGAQEVIEVQDASGESKALEGGIGIGHQ